MTSEPAPPAAEEARVEVEAVEVRPASPPPEQREPPGLEEALRREARQAAALLESAGAVLVIAGAGMGVDSGLDSFRDSQGCYTLEDYHAKCRHELFLKDPEAAWSFHGHALHRFREAEPHQGFADLLAICRTKGNYFVVTSNVDGHFEKAGFPAERVFNAHGSVHFWQCTRPACSSRREPWEAGDWQPRVLPKCKYCGAPARPNVSLFDDNQEEYPDSFSGVMVLRQFGKFEAWLRQARKRRLCILEIGCGESEHSLRLAPQPKGRWACISDEWGIEPIAASLVRVDPKPTERPVPQRSAAPFVQLSAGARDALKLLASAIAPAGCPSEAPPRAAAAQGAPGARHKAERRKAARRR
mmetsp:Transcript_19360/g.61380  ORF Transcript_19360/g.61380 Transcript_19360/m.61380 type:complete len:357 (-) Transcript_19360:58-1128(-)